MPAANVIQLRQLLTEQFPGSRVRLNEASTPGTSRGAVDPGAVDRQTDVRLHLAHGALTEIVAAKRGSGSALLLAALIQQALRENQFVALVDGSDSFDVTRFDGGLSRLLWVRCRSADEALKAADLILRDKNLPLVLLDLAANPIAQTRRIPATAWYRFQRLVEHTSAACVVLTSSAMVSAAHVRKVLSGRFSLSALERDPVELLKELQLSVSETRGREWVREPLQSTA
jgi:hypothetical protein